MWLQPQPVRLHLGSTPHVRCVLSGWCVGGAGLPRRMRELSCMMMHVDERCFLHVQFECCY